MVLVFSLLTSNKQIPAGLTLMRLTVKCIQDQKLTLDFNRLKCRSLIQHNSKIRQFKADKEKERKVTPWSLTAWNTITKIEIL